MHKRFGILGIAMALTAVAASCAPQKPPPSADTNPNYPGATGRSDVVGDPSTIAGDKKATQMQKQDSYAR
jgi:hypothetical protein